MTLLDFALLILATYYLQHILRWEGGPFGIFDAVREGVFGVRVIESQTFGTHQQPIRPGTLADLVMCIYCTSFWIGLLLLAGWWFWHPVVWPFALAGAASIVGGLNGSK